MEEYKNEQYKEEEKKNIEVLWKVIRCKLASIFTRSSHMVCILMDTCDSLQSHTKEKRC